MTEFFQTRSFLVGKECFYVAIEFARVGRISVATGDFYVTTVLATTESSAAHDRAGRAKAGTHDSVAPCYLMTEEVMCSRQTRPGVHDGPWVRKTKTRTRQRNYVATDLDIDKKKKKKRLLGFGASQNLIIFINDICIYLCLLIKLN